MRCSTWWRVLVMSEGSCCPVTSGDVSRGGSKGSGRNETAVRVVGAGLGLTILRPAACPAACPATCPGRVGTGDIGKTEDMGETGSGSALDWE